MSTSQKNLGRLKWNAVSARDAQRFDEHGATSPAPQSPKFLKDLPPLSAVYEPKQPVTRRLKKLIEDNAYAGAFQNGALAGLGGTTDKRHSLSE